MQIILLPASAASSSSSTSATLRKFQNAIAPKSCASSSSSEHDCDSLADESYEQQSTVSRKRQRLNDLTEQEKLFRRKLKNRVAAQTARDKKKAKMEELEIIVEQLRIENERLKAENHLLLAEKMRLSNKEEVAPNVVLKEENVREMEAEMYPVESAALINGPLPQEQGYIQATVFRMLLQLMLLLQSPAAQSKPVQTDLVAVLEQMSLISQEFQQEPKLIQELVKSLGSERPQIMSAEILRQPP